MAAKIQFIIPLFCLSALNLQAQTTFTGLPGADIHDSLNWDNGLPALGNDGTLSIDADSTGSDTLLDWGTLTVDSVAILSVPSRLRVYDNTSIILQDGTLAADANIALRSPAAITMENAASELTTAGNLVVPSGTALTLTDGEITLGTEGKKFNIDGTANLVGGSMTLNSFFEGGGDGVLNLTDTQITVETPLEEATTLTVFRINDPWTFNFVSGGTGTLRIVGRDDVDEIEAIITGGAFFTIDGVADANLSSYSLTFDGSDTVLSLRSGPPTSPRIISTSFDSGTRTFSMTWESNANSTYTVDENPDKMLGSWRDLDDSVEGKAGSTTYSIPGLPTEDTERFYRVSENP